MVRKLDKIEKELGYCEIKLEKERRLRRQVEFLRSDLDVLDSFVEIYDASGNRNSDNKSSVTRNGNRLADGELSFDKVAPRIVHERQSRDEPGPYFRRTKTQFKAAGILELVSEERENVNREIEEIEAKFESFAAFGKKREDLAEEKREALSSVQPPISSRFRKLDEDFRKTEQLWNSLTEDALNLEEATFFLARNVDYLKSSRSFLIAAKGSFDIEGWIENGYSGNLFRHSNVGRAKEMIAGANRNLKLAHKELVCVCSLKFENEGFEPILVSFLDAMFDDVFLDGRLERAIKVVEDAISCSEKRLRKVRQRREQLYKKLQRVERARADMFQRLGVDRRGSVAVS